MSIAPGQGTVCQIGNTEDGRKERGRHRAAPSMCRGKYVDQPVVPRISVSGTYSWNPLGGTHSGTHRRS